MMSLDDRTSAVQVSYDLLMSVSRETRKTTGIAKEKVCKSPKECSRCSMHL